jgi:hypothetical protein
MIIYDYFKTKTLKKEKEEKKKRSPQNTIKSKNNFHIYITS